MAEFDPFQDASYRAFKRGQGLDDSQIDAELAFQDVTRQRRRQTLQDNLSKGLTRGVRSVAQSFAARGIYDGSGRRTAEAELIADTQGDYETQIAQDYDEQAYDLRSAALRKMSSRNQEAELATGARSQASTDQGYNYFN